MFYTTEWETLEEVLDSQRMQYSEDDNSPCHLQATWRIVDPDTYASRIATFQIQEQPPFME